MPELSQITRRTTALSHTESTTPEPEDSEATDIDATSIDVTDIEASSIEVTDIEAADIDASNTEASEAEAMFLMLAGVAEPHRSLLGTSAVRMDDGVVLAMANDPVDYWSKALGFGLDSAISGDLVQRIVDRFVECGVASATLQFAPHLLPEDWHLIRARYGLEAESTWVKMVGVVAPESPPVSFPGVTPAPELEAADPSGGLRIGRVDPSDIAEWAHVIVTGFGMPSEHLPSLLVGAAKSPSTHAFAAWDGDSMVAGASLVVRGEVGHLAGAATLASHRGRGAQSALIAARIQAARDTGVCTLYAETGKPERTGDNSSLNNLIRAGLWPLYDRINWRWTAGVR
jgi:GNAT superfamily N-acetyltransferase